MESSNQTEEFEECMQCNLHAMQIGEQKPEDPWFRKIKKS